MSEKRKYRTFTPEQKLEIVLAGIRGDRSTRDVCREYGIAETLYYQWRDRLLEGGKAPLASPRDRGTPSEAAELREAKKRIGQLERALGKKTYELRSRGNSRGTGRERPRVQSPRGGRHGTTPHDRGVGGGHLSTGDLPAAHASPAGGRPRQGRR